MSLQSLKARLNGLPRIRLFRALGHGSLSTVLKIALDVAFWVLLLATALLLIGLTVVLFFPISDLNLTISDDTGGRQLPLTKPLMLFAIGSAAAYVGAFTLILRSLRLIFRTLTQGDPFHPDNVRRLRQVGVILAVVTGGVWFFQGMAAARLAPGILDRQGIGELLTPAFSVLVVFVLAEVFREGARLRRESELTI